MKNVYVPAPKGKIVVRSASPRLKIALCLLIVTSMASLLTLRWVHGGILAETARLTQEAAAVESANRKLEEKIDKMTTDEIIPDIARDDLGLVSPDTVVFDLE